MNTKNAFPPWEKPRKPMHYDFDGKPISINDWGVLMESPQRHFGKTNLYFDMVLISTVWIGIDHSFSLNKNKPIIFETMVFLGYSALDVDMERYSTKQEALLGHDKMVRKWKNPFFTIPKIVQYYVDKNRV